MQKIHLFSQYDAAALFLKTTNELEDQVGLWPEEFLEDGELEKHISSLKESFTLRLPEIDFNSGRQLIIDRILPLSEFQPGMRKGVNVRVSVLMYKYALKESGYLFGCRPSIPLPEPAGEWFTNQINQELCVEYEQYARQPKKAIAAHQQNVPFLQQAHQALKGEFEQFNDSLEGIIRGIVGKRKEDADHIRRIRMMMS
ncbi:hypothetical protein DYBT9623_00548 [Dyadobacter sp. CECT 9623]|jgi:hypothetical protein|uniref:Uncharacterized protein n=1 Tax=Dyadobacter linearis TaxID=2823330 RepID=A0ABM8UKN4_9BACT|nr:hypothetical protein [Dyadobacter sp. CECT 9623]CAG5067821.1 hypothetical protein DYBT9623_00548 [Dyadobacter sp. CECT 9623]